MKRIGMFLFSLCLIFLHSNSFAFTDPKVGGTVTLKKGLESKLVPGGVLFVIAKKAGPDSGPGDRSPPIAVIKIERPKFPQAFVITAKNVMIPGTTLQGPLHVVARYSPTGDAMPAPGSIEGLDAKHPSVELGVKDLQIELSVVRP